MQKDGTTRKGLWEYDQRKKWLGDAVKPEKPYVDEQTKEKDEVKPEP